MESEEVLEISLAASWERYRQQVVPAEASEFQVHDTRCAFYGGANVVAMMLQLAKTLTRRDPVNGPAMATELLNNLFREVNDFNTEIVRDIAQKLADDLVKGQADGQG